MDKILFIDTCSSRLVLSFIFDEKIIDTKYTMTNKNMTEIFNYELEHFFNSNNVSKDEINKIFVINGPGSFVGVKIGIVFSNLYSFLNNAKIYYLDSCSFQSTSLDDISIIDAKSNLYYTKIIKNNNCIELLKMEDIKKISNNKKLIIKDDYINYKFEDCWNFNKNNFLETNKLEGNYVKKPI